MRASKAIAVPGGSALPLTDEAEAVCQCIAHGMSHAEAFQKLNGPAGTGLFLGLSESMLGRIDEIRKGLPCAQGITLVDHLARLDDLSRGAEEHGKYSAAIVAEVARGRASGLYKDNEDEKLVAERPTYTQINYTVVASNKNPTESAEPSTRSH